MDELAVLGQLPDDGMLVKERQQLLPGRGAVE
jgi:hypothetical protein